MWKLLTSSTIVLTFFCNASSRTHIIAHPIECLRVHVKNPVPAKDGSIVQNDNFFNIYYYKDLVMYNFHVPYDSSIDNKTVKLYRSPFFIYKRNSEVGYSYDKTQPQWENKELLVDSVRHMTGLQNFQWHVFLTRQPISSGIDSAGNYKEVYSDGTGNSNNQKDSIIFYYSNYYKKFDFSFSKDVDNVKGRKLFMIRILYRQDRNAENGNLIPARESLFEMKEVPVAEPAEIKSRFQRFEREHGG